ncbi:GNAT family N-acetyltransferase [Hahella sp. HN01]|uniref:GNAT family N-acetyltransferase n=1 Tax=Hahella sp. HN01 TaxID=2847262 RepID=UPI001C1EA569|nr:GNAT family N-acetyltransferase [Hahella sp. HN01]MBU6953533.1 GNAT family N-acetyltransferase [Hahella sp. HN01]
MRIRPATVEDAPTIAVIHVAAWREAYRGLMSSEFLASLSVEKRTQQWTAALAQDSPILRLVIEHEGCVAGFCSSGAFRDEQLAREEGVELYSINIDPNYWRHGLGKGLIEYVSDYYLQKKAKAIYLWVLNGNQRAMAFYKNLGFLPDGRSKVDYGHAGEPLHELLYVRDLTTST